MKTLFTIAGLLLISNLGWAASPRHFKCAHEAWDASKPTQVQKDQARVNFAPVKKMYTDSKDKITVAKSALMAAFKTHPIVKGDVESTGKELHALLVPIKMATLSAAIDSINLLTLSQRQLFDSALKACKMRNHLDIDADPTEIEWEPTSFASFL